MDCNWERFNNLSDHGKLDSKPKSGVLYDFYFGYFTRTQGHKEYLTLRKGLFKSFNLGLTTRRYKNISNEIDNWYEI